MKKGFKKKVSKLIPEEAKLMPVLKFLIKFNIFVIPLYFILVTDWTFIWLQTTTAQITYWLLDWAGYSPVIDNLLITIPIKNGNWAAFINWDCTGWKSILAFFALVMSTDYPLRRKISGLLLIPLIYIVNIARIFFMFYYVRTYDLQNYELVHSIVWGWGLIIIVLLLWFLWMTSAKMDFFSTFQVKCPTCRCKPCACPPPEKPKYLDQPAKPRKNRGKNK